ncbi:hypothetical protein [Streptomyces hirsutus]|uniref:hypothetical protein n=1 Tax=Streptomyces hirsutus TaxID=35620 RepID=UPI003330D1B5
MRAVISFAIEYQPPKQEMQGFQDVISGMPVLLAAFIATTLLLYTLVFHALFTLLFGIPYALAMRIMTVGVSSRRSKAAVARQTVLIGRIAAVAISADRVRRMGARNHAPNMNRLFRDLRVLKRQLARQHQSVYVPIFSARARRLRNHQRIVVAALNQIEQDLDRAPSDSLKAIVVCALEIAENYSRGLYGALLASDKLEGIEPGRDWEPLRLMLAAALIAATAIAVSFFDIPDPAITALLGATGLISITLLYGRGARSALDVVDIVRG